MRHIGKLLAAAASLLAPAAFAQQVPSFPPANLPLSGAETLYIIQNGTNRQTPVSTVQGGGTFTSVSTGTLSVSGNSTLGFVGLNGELVTVAPSGASSGVNFPPGTAPTAPINGDIWTTATGLFVQVNGSTVGPLGTGGGGGVPSCLTSQIPYYAASGTTLSCLTTLNNGVLITSGSAVPSIATTLPTGLTIPPVILTIKNYATSAALPVVTGSNSGQMAFVANCLNGAQGSGGNGCFYGVDSTGTWQPAPFIPTSTLTFGSQALKLTQTAAAQGTGGLVQLSTGSFTSGHCVQFDATGNTVDAGGACTTGGGGGTVTSGTTPQLAWYAATGTTVSGLAQGANSVLVSNGSSIPSWSTTLPSGLSASSMTLPAAVLTTTGTYVNLTGSGKLTTTASATGASGLNLVPGVAPTSPANGDLWVTSTAIQARVNGTTLSLGTGSGTITSVATSSPITGGTITVSGTIACPTCATTTNGGAIAGTPPIGVNAAGAISCATCVTSTGGGGQTATAPISVNAAGNIACLTCATTGGGGALSATTPIALTGNVVSIGPINTQGVFNFDTLTTVHNDTYYISPKWPWATGTIQSITYATSGTGTPSFNVALQINGTNVTSCNGVTVSSVSITTTTCTGANTITTGQPLTLVITATNGSPFSTVLAVNFAHSMP